MATPFFSKYIPRKDRPAFLFLAIAGTSGHFLYEWTGSPLAALFCPVNESVWEHLKLLYFPFLILTLRDYFRSGKKAYAFYRLLAVLCGMLSIVMLFYTYTGIIGQNYLIPDILIFFFGILLTLRLIPVLRARLSSTPSPTAIYAAWLLLTLTFFLFTCHPPDLPIFYSA